MHQVLCIKHVMWSSHKLMRLRLKGVESFAQGHLLGLPVEPGLEPLLVWFQISCLWLPISLFELCFHVREYWPSSPAPQRLSSYPSTMIFHFYVNNSCGFTRSTSIWFIPQTSPEMPLVGWHCRDGHKKRWVLGFTDHPCTLRDGRWLPYDSQATLGGHSKKKHEKEKQRWYQ